MSGPANLQLLLLDTAHFEAGPSRARPPRRPRAESDSPASDAGSLVLQFEKPAPAASAGAGGPVDEARRLALERSRARLRAKLEPAAALQRKPPPETPPAEDVLDWAPAEVTGGAEVSVFLVRRKLTAQARSSMMRAFAGRLGGDLKRSDCFEARADADSVSGQLDAKSLMLRFSGRSARQRWLATVQRLAREHDLVEPE